MDQNQNQNPKPTPPSATPVGVPKKMKINPVVPAIIIFGAIAAFLAVWYMAVR